MSRSIVDLPRAVVFTAHSHVNQRRKGETAEPNINHVIEVAHMLAGVTDGRDRELVIAGNARNEDDEPRGRGFESC